MPEYLGRDATWATGMARGSLWAQVPQPPLNSMSRRREASPGPAPVSSSALLNILDKVLRREAVLQEVDCLYPSSVIHHISRRVEQRSKRLPSLAPDNCGGEGRLAADHFSDSTWGGR